MHEWASWRESASSGMIREKEVSTISVGEKCSAQIQNQFFMTSSTGTDDNVLCAALWC